MGPVSAEIEIDVPRERAFEAIADLALRPSFTDHFLTGFHLTRIESTGIGAGARFQFEARACAGLDGHDDRRARRAAPDRRARPRRPANRIPRPDRLGADRGPGIADQGRVSHWTEPANPVDRALELLLGDRRSGTSARWREALRRLRDLLESDAPPAERVAVAGGNRHATGIP